MFLRHVLARFDLSLSLSLDHVVTTSGVFLLGLVFLRKGVQVVAQVEHVLLSALLLLLFLLMTLQFLLPSLLLAMHLTLLFLLSPFLLLLLLLLLVFILHRLLLLLLLDLRLQCVFLGLELAPELAGVQGALIELVLESFLSGVVLSALLFVEFVGLVHEVREFLVFEALDHGGFEGYGGFAVGVEGVEGLTEGEDVSIPPDGREEHPVRRHPVERVVVGVVGGDTPVKVGVHHLPDACPASPEHHRRPPGRTDMGVSSEGSHVVPGEGGHDLVLVERH